MYLILSNNERYEIRLEQNHLAGNIQKAFQHLQHTPIPWRDWDNPFLISTQSQTTIVDNLKSFANKLSIEIDVDLCRQQDQTYLNYLHKIYEESYNGDSAWLDFHEHIHLCEQNSPAPLSLAIKYREKAGPLERKFDPSFRQYFKQQVQAGEVYLAFSELGKTPYQYWKNNEPDNIIRICQLAKPWLVLRPQLYIAFSDQQFLHDNIDCNKFNSWWKQYHNQWCQHWEIDEWTIEDMFAVSVIGHITDIDQLKDSLIQGHYPAWIKF